jgi:tRNA 2-thiouridine synthesizing protein D
MQFSLLILGSPSSTQSASTAFRFARAVINSGHTLYRVFFYHDGVYCSNDLVTPPQDEESLPANWATLAAEHDVDLVVCIASALKRGVIDKAEAERHEKSAANLAQGFSISGLGQLVDASIVSDRVITFGP